MQNRLGAIEKGKIADLVLLDANPLDDISNTKRIAAVVLNGRYLSKESRERMLADVEAAANRRAGGADKPGKGSKYGSAN
jgi:imidazolonepropionase-like amidohydrolase